MHAEVCWQDEFATRTTFGHLEVAPGLSPNPETALNPDLEHTNITAHDEVQTGRCGAKKFVITEYVS